MNKIDIKKTINYKEEDDIFAPPASPPPPHLIYFPETYHAGNHNKSWQPPMIAEEKKKEKAYFVRRQIYCIAKSLIKTILKNNNILLILNILNKLWRSRASLIEPTLIILNHYLQQGTLLPTTLFFNRNIQHNKGGRTPQQANKSIILILTHVLVRFQKLGYKTIRNMGGLDSVILAISAILFTKSIQTTPRRII
ncbi:hypothetical protein BD770DRAFT_397978 [Pilaira anomala]|nr:hypothetical protein BD770DRAFT_397978 [Pilaira anomala]